MTSLSIVSWLAGVALMVLLLIALRRWARALPIAYGWNPETHDRQTVMALDILRGEDRPTEPVTLLGWALRQLASHQRLHEELVGQVRRGAVEEDMNSHTINEFEAASAIADALLIGATLVTLNPWVYAIYVAKKYAGSKLEHTEAIAGANGGYHFFNAMLGDDKAGLSEPTFVGRVLSKVSGAIGTGNLKPPMPSALERATDSTPSRCWPFDYEDRNYTYDDALRYFRLGYPALGFYALGRVAHLLQDMAVPAHVRDDSHLGIPLPPPYGEPGEPLEYLAGDLDWAQTVPQEAANTSREVRWSYRWRRGFSTVGSNPYDAALSEYRGLRGGSKGASARQHFYDLARWAHQSFYSLGTIPGNPDSHNPNAVTEQPWWRKGASVDWRRCAANVKGFCTTIGMLVANAKAILESHRATVKLYEDQLQLIQGRQDLSDMRGQVMAERVFGQELLELLANEVQPAVEAMDASQARFVAAVDAFAQLAKRMMALSDPNPQFGPYSASQWDHPLMRPFREQIQAMDLDRLLGVSRNASDTSSALQHYIRGFGDDEQRLAKAFEPAMPFCLPRDVLVSQYNRTTAHAVAHSATLMADWFEGLYAPGENCGVGLWQNADAESGEIPTAYRVEQSSDATAAKTFGVANHLPVPVDMTCEFTLVGLTDAKTGATVADRSVAVNVVLAHVSPLAGAVGLDVRGRTEQGVRIKLRESGSFTFGATPHAFGVQRAFEWPAKGAWGAGAMRRDEEAAKLKPVNLTPGQRPGGVTATSSDDFFATFLRVSGRMVPEEKGQA